MSAARDEVVADIHRLLAANQELGDQLIESRNGFAVGLGLLEEGTPLSEALAHLHSAERRMTMTDRLAEFDECRHRLRISITAAGLEEGMSIGDIGRAFGVSRQLAARFAREVRSQSEPLEPPAPRAP